MMPLKDVVMKSSIGIEATQLHAFCAQAWNHNFMWLTMTNNYQNPSEFIMKSFEIHFGGFSAFKKRVQS